MSTNIPQISNPISNRGYSPNTLLGKQAGGEQFDIIQLLNPLETAATRDREAGRRGGTLLEQKDFLPMSVKLTKDPTMAVESLKQIINFDLLAIAKANGYTELYGELDKLMKSIFLQPGDIVAELMSQEKSTTFFGDEKLYDLMRNLAGSNKPNADELKAAIGNMLKAINFSRNQAEILSALSSNMRFLSHYFLPNKALSADLAGLADRWAMEDAPKNFEQLKNETLFLTKSVSESLLNNERIQVLIPLIVHNLSRYNTNKAVLHEYFGALLTQVSGQRMREELTDAFSKLAEKLLGGAGLREAQQAHQTFKETGLPPTPEQEAASKTASNAPVLTAPQAEPGAIARYLGEKLADENYLASLYLDEDALSYNARSYFDGNSGGFHAIKSMLNLFINNPEMKMLLNSEMSQLDDVSKLVEYLNNILRVMPDIPERQAFYEHLTAIINQMVEKDEIPVPREANPFAGADPNVDKTQQQSQQTVQTQIDEKKESTLKQLIEFVERNIDHAAIKTIHNYNASNLLQSLINAPGVFTPLAHYIIPLEVEGMKSFGELWVDSDEGNASAKATGRNCKYHLFLTFEVEAAGRFEIDLYADGLEVNLSFFYPESFSHKAGGLLGKVGRIIAQSGYSTKEIRTGPLLRPHDLTQVFPDILARRMGFNVKA